MISNDWTQKERLMLIKALAQMRYEDGINGLMRNESDTLLMERIMFLCDMPAELLEINRHNYTDAIKLANAELSVNLK